MLESGLIIDIGKYTVTVITKDNGYYKILRKPTMCISQEIQFKRSDVINVSYFAKRSSVVAAAILTVFLMFFYSNLKNENSTFASQNLAYVSLDINPSLQFTINGDDKVIDVDLIGKDAKKLLGEWKPQGLKIEDAFYGTIKICREKGIIETLGKNFFLISGTFNLDNKMNKDQVAASDERIILLMNKLKENISSMLPGENEILIVKCEPYEKEAAEKNNISLGRYALYSELYKEGDIISLEDAKNFTVSDLIKAYRKVDSNTFISYTPLPSATPASTPESIPASTSVTQTFTSVPNTGSDKIIGSERNTTETPRAVNTATPTPVEKGSGLRGEYYDNIDLTKLKLSRIDSQISFKWDYFHPPAKELKNDESYSVRWTGQIKPPKSGKYTFHITRDNGVRLWIDNNLILDKWTNEWNVSDSGTIALEGGKKYDIKIEYYNNAGDGIIKLEWSSSLIDKAVVPTSCLFPATSSLTVQNTVPGDGTGLSSEYYDNPDFTSKKVTGTDPEINFNWGVGSPDIAITLDQQFSIRWTGYIQPVFSEDYIFYVTYDDCVRLWINGKLEIDQWKTGKTFSETRKIPLKADQKYSIKLEYANNSGYGKVKLEWSSPSTKRSLVPMSRLFPLK